MHLETTMPDRWTGRRAAMALVLSMSVATAAELDGYEKAPIPSFRELEAAGAVIGEIRVNKGKFF
jgi:hypothetical protein